MDHRHNNARRFVPAVLLCCTGLLTACSSSGSGGASGPTGTGDLKKLFNNAAVTVIVPTDSGGSYDVVARAIQSYVGKYLPAQPRIRVVDMPGAAQLTGDRALYMAKPDGLTIGMYSNRTSRYQLAGNKIKGFDATKVEYLGTLTAGEHRSYFLCANPKEATSWDEAVAGGRKLTAGATGPGGGGSLSGELVQLLGGPVKMVFGYESVTSAVNAFNTGELTATTYCDTRYAARNPQWAKMSKPFPAPLAWMGATPDPAYLSEMRWTLPPNLLDLLKLSAAQKDAVNTLLNLETLDAGFMLPPRTPKAVVAAWETALAAVVKEPKVVKALVAGGLTPGYASGADLLKALNVIETLPPDGEKLFRDLTPKTIS